MKKYNKRTYTRRSNKRKLYLVTVFFLLLSIGLGYAYLQSVLTFSGTTKISKNNWDIHFDNLTSTDNTKVSIQNNTSVVLNVTLNPGEEFTYTVDAVNDGSIDAMIGSISPITVPAAYQNVIEYSLNYEQPGENEVISINDALRSNTSEKIRFTVRYKSESELSGDVVAVTLNLNFTVNYIQADENITDIVHDYTVCSANKNKSFSTNVVCKRAEKLRQEECNPYRGSGCLEKGYSQGDMVTYGNCGGTTLESGDAFDCDLNGNGVVDTDENGNSTERFYYVSDLYTGTIDSVDQFDSDYAVLIYYKNYGSLGVSYYYENSARKNWRGPITLLNKSGTLPERTDWTNTKIGLKSTSRNIYTERGTTATSGGTIENPFVYTNKVARLLTTQEIDKALNSTSRKTTGYLDNAEYLMEDSYYTKTSGCSGGSCDYWLETPLANNSNYAWFVIGGNRNVGSSIVDGAFGSRPVIEIPKTDISFN